jgi:hypothetical protein
LKMLEKQLSDNLLYNQSEKNNELF